MLEAQAFKSESQKSTVAERLDFLSKKIAYP